MADPLALDLISALIAFAVQALITVALYLFLPESIREPLRSAFLRLRKWILDPALELQFSKRLGLREPLQSENLRAKVATALRDAKLFNPGEVPRSFNFPVATSSFAARADISVAYDPELPEGETGALVLSLATQTNYRRLRASLENLRATEDEIRQVLQNHLSLVESGLQITIKLRTDFPMSSFFKSVQPLVLKCTTRSGTIDFDYVPGLLTARGVLDAEMIQWLRGAIAAL